MQSLKKNKVYEPFIKVLEDIYKYSTAASILHRDTEKKKKSNKERRWTGRQYFLYFAACLEGVFTQEIIKWNNTEIN